MKHIKKIRAKAARTGNKGEANSFNESVRERLAKEGKRIMACPERNYA